MTNEILTCAFLGGLERVGVQLDGVGRTAAIVRVNTDVKPQAGRQVADGKGRSVGRHVSGQRLPMAVVDFHDEPLADSAVETGLAPDDQRFRRLVHHRAVLQAVRTP